MLVDRRACQACSDWVSKNPRRGVCLRCSHIANLNRNQLCRLCLVTIRTMDKTWLADPRPHRSTPLFLLLPEVRLPIARPLDRTPAAPRTLPPRNPAWVCAELATPPKDDPEVCPPLPSGQQLLFTAPRTLTLRLVARIADRVPAGYLRAAEAAHAYVAENDFTIAWRRRLCRMLGLVLAAAAADGLDLVDEAAIADADLADSLIVILAGVGLLKRETSSDSPPGRRTPSGARSCSTCLSWGLEPTCGRCRYWARTYPHGRCTRCHHDAHVGAAGLCHPCTVVVTELGPQTMATGARQLTLGGAFAPRLSTPKGLLGYRPRHWKSADLERARRPDPPPISPHLVDPAQTVVVQVRRDWSVITPGKILPSLTADADAVIADVRREATELGWNTSTGAQVMRTLRILLGWIGAQAPIPEEDIRSLPGLVRHTSATRVVFMLERRGLVIPAHDRTTIAEQRWVANRIQRLPASFAEELDRWVTAMRGHGRRRRHPRSWDVIGNYLRAVHPILLRWSTKHTSLREITPDHVKAALDNLTGTPAQGARTGLRSIFSMLKQERVTFRDPTRGIVLPAISNVPVPLRDDQLRGLIDRVHAPLDRFVVALVAIHALHTKDLPALRLDGVDTANGKLTLRRDQRRHTYYLDEFTHILLAAWLHDRQQRWPTSTNPHLFLTAATAFHRDDAPISMSSLTLIFRRVGINAHRIREDRLLHEATVTADPVHLMRVFGVSAGTAMRYVHAAHPERATVPPSR
ncbi:hypothetical protein [Nonomuraea typhae]|uniref:hypothetical protein n=1 Tax=Nonomuraea typhae TaxID=2603600 RepID=UPI0012F8EB34|nr:hypothetical protein [Nonomuraea typhae]